MLLVALLAVLAQPLGGPIVRPAPVSIIETDFLGRLRRPETSPERAALDALALSPADRERLDALLAPREALLDRFVADNLLLLGQFDTAVKGGSHRHALALAFTLLRALAPVIEPGPLRSQIARALDPDSRRRFLSLLRDYDAALVRDARAAGNPAPRTLILLGERLRELGEDIARSFQRQQNAGTIFADALLSGIDLSPEQARAFHDLKLDLLERTAGRASETDQRNLVLAILARLSESQRARVLPRIPR